MALDAIPIHVINTPSGEPGLTGNALPLLRELLEQVRRLLDSGEPSAIDLSALPLTPADLDWLRAQGWEAAIKKHLRYGGKLIGLCGGYTTFSSFSLQTLNLAQEGDWLRAGINIVALHNHMMMESPRMMFLHFWGVGSTEALAKGLKAALATQKP